MKTFRSTAMRCFRSLCVKTGSFIKRRARHLLAAGVLIMAGLGAAIYQEARSPAGVPASTFNSHVAGQSTALAASDHAAPTLVSLGVLALLGVGLVFGFKHATEADHIIAVSTIVSEHRNIWRAALVGGLWGLGHTASLLVVGVIVLVLRVTIPERVANWLEFGLALMIIGLGLNVLVRALRQRGEVHVHQHHHDGVSHAHIHFHEAETKHAAPVVAHSHVVSRIGLKPLLVGAAHGLAGSATLTLLVLTQIKSIALGLLYLAIFGVGSVFGMLLMSSVVGLPFALSARRLPGMSQGLQTAAGALSIVCGLWYAYQTVVINLF